MHAYIDSILLKYLFTPHFDTITHIIDCYNRCWAEKKVATFLQDFRLSRVLTGGGWRGKNSATPQHFSKLSGGLSSVSSDHFLESFVVYRSTWWPGLHYSCRGQHMSEKHGWTTSIHGNVKAKVPNQQMLAHIREQHKSWTCNTGNVVRIRPRLALLKSARIATFSCRLCDVATNGFGFCDTSSYANKKNIERRIWTAK